MTWPRVILLLCAVLALVEGRVWEAVGIVALVGVLAAFAPSGLGRRPWPIRMWFVFGRWQRR